MCDIDQQPNWQLYVLDTTHQYDEDFWRSYKRFHIYRANTICDGQADGQNT